MEFKVIPTKFFIKKIKKLKKKYPNIITDIDNLVLFLKKNPENGIHLGRSIYKIRLKSSDITKGKSGALRIIYYMLTRNSKIYLLTIYFKGKKENISWSEIENLLKEIEL